MPSLLVNAEGWAGFSPLTPLSGAREEMPLADTVGIPAVTPPAPHKLYTQLVKMRLVLEGTARESCGDERALYFAV